jgi:hypothetical protein
MRQQKRVIGWLTVLGSVGVLLSGCVIPRRLGWLPTPVPMTPTPHYAPMTGQAYIAPGAERSPLWNVPSLPRTRTATVAANTQVEILEARWFYAQGRFKETMCYMYRVRVPSDPEVEGWITQGGLTQTYGEKVPFEQRCFRGGEPTPTPPYDPLTGFVYVTVGAGRGIAGSPTEDPRQSTPTIFAHGVQVKIIYPVWVRYEATEEFPAIACYMYKVVHLDTITNSWLPGDVLIQHPAAAPQGGCFSDPALLSVYDIFPTSPEGLDVITPEAGLE